MTPLLLKSSRSFPVSVEEAYDLVLPTPLPQLFHRRYGVIPPIREVRDQVGEWGSELGQTRTIRLADGGTMRETLTVLERPGAFGYHLDRVTGPMRPLVRSVEGHWAFDPVGTGVWITWTWSVEPVSTLVRPVLPVFEGLWNGYARQALEEIEKLLVGRG